MYGTRPNIDHLRVFGCLVYASTLKANRSKFDSRAIPCVMMGYETGQKGYKLLNLETNKLFVSRDVTFHEKHLPFHLSDSPQTPLNPIFLPSHTPFNLPEDQSLPDAFILPTAKRDPHTETTP